MKRLLVFGLFLALACLGPTLGCGSSPPGGGADAGNQGADAAVTCGNGTVDTSLGETCDTAIPSGTGACPTSCPSSGDACNPSVLKHAGSCTAVCAAEPVTACKSGDGCCPSGCASANDGDCSQMADTTGTWFSYTSAKGTLKTTPPKNSGAAPITDNNVTINTWVRSYTSPSGDIRFNICRLEVNGSIIKTTYTQKVVNTFQATAHDNGNLQVPVGSTITLPTYTIYSGQDASGNAVDTVPPPFPSGDGDGKPGVTVPTQANLILVWYPFDNYSGITITTAMNDVKVTSPTTKTGKTTVTTHGVTFGSTNTTISPVGSTFDLTFNSGSIPFTSTKLADDDSATYSCEYLAQHYP